jgi:hypothetical protein
LVPDAELVGLKKAIEHAVSDGGKFVDVAAAGDVTVSILVTPGVPILLTSREVVTADDDTIDTVNVNTADTFDVTEWEIRGTL